MRAALISDLKSDCLLLPHILQAIWYCQTCSCIVQLECASSVHPLRFLSEVPPFHTQFFMFLAFSMVFMSELGLEPGSGALQLPKRQALLLCIWPPGPVQLLSPLQASPQQSCSSCSTGTHRIQPFFQECS